MRKRRKGNGERERKENKEKGEEWESDRWTDRHRQTNSRPGRQTQTHRLTDRYTDIESYRYICRHRHRWQRIHSSPCVFTSIIRGLIFCTNSSETDNFPVMTCIKVRILTVQCSLRDNDVADATGGRRRWYVDKRGGKEREAEGE